MESWSSCHQPEVCPAELWAKSLSACANTNDESAGVMLSPITSVSQLTFPTEGLSVLTRLSIKANCAADYFSKAHLSLLLRYEAQTITVPPLKRRWRKRELTTLRQ